MYRLILTDCNDYNDVKFVHTDKDILQVSLSHHMYISVTVTQSS